MQMAPTGFFASKKARTKAATSGRTSASAPLKAKVQWFLATP